MRTIFLSLVACIVIYSCNQKNDSAPAPAADTIVVPDALQDNKNSSRGSYSKQEGPGGLVEELFDELKDQTPALQQLEENIDRIKVMREVSIELFNKYDSKNNSYYGSAQIHFRSISDSLIRERVRAMINASLARYENMTTTNKDLLAILNKKDATVNDLYTVLKLTKSMEMIEKFQRQNLPSTKPLEKVNKEYDKVISQL
jgi:hypothetical protein